MLSKTGSISDSDRRRTDPGDTLEDPRGSGRIRPLMRRGSTDSSAWESVSHFLGRRQTTGSSSLASMLSVGSSVHVNWNSISPKRAEFSERARARTMPKSGEPAGAPFAGKACGVSTTPCTGVVRALAAHPNSCRKPSRHDGYSSSAPPLSLCLGVAGRTELVAVVHGLDAKTFGGLLLGHVPRCRGVQGLARYDSHTDWGAGSSSTTL